MPTRRLAKVKPLNPKRRKKKVKGPELVRQCDCCGKKFKVTYARIETSALFAYSRGNVFRKRDGVICIFCDDNCAIKNIDGSGVERMKHDKSREAECV